MTDKERLRRECLKKENDFFESVRVHIRTQAIARENFRALRALKKKYLHMPETDPEREKIRLEYLHQRQRALDTSEQRITSQEIEERNAIEDRYHEIMKKGPPQAYSDQRERKTAEE